MEIFTCNPSFFPTLTILFEQFEYRDVDFVSKKNCKRGQKIIINILLLLSRKPGLSTGPKIRRNPSVIFLHKSSYLNVINWFTLFNSTITLTFLIELYIQLQFLINHIYIQHKLQRMFSFSVYNTCPTCRILRFFHRYRSMYNSRWLTRYM